MEPDVSSLELLVIGMHYTPETTGNAPYTTGMVRALAEAGHRVRVITGYPHYPSWQVSDGYSGLRKSERIGDVPVTRVRHPVPATPTASRRALMDLLFTLHAAAVGGPRPDVVITVSPVLLTVAAGLRWRKPGRTALGVVTQDLYSRALAETGMTSAHSAALVAQLERWLLNRTDGIAVVHENFARDLAELGVRPELVTVIPNWSHIGRAVQGREETRRQLGWRRDEIIALHAGNMGVKQGLENVVDAARFAADTSPTVRFVLLGDGGRRRQLAAAAASVRNLAFLDPVPGGRFEEVLAAADVLVLNEASGVAQMSVPSKLTSYFSAGLPVVAATHHESAASKEIDRSGGGIRVDPGEPRALYEAVLAIGRDPARGHRLGSAGKRYAEEHLTVERASRAYQDWVESLAASRERDDRQPEGRSDAEVM
jgi:glycosyltransferase involved in cell wall biosynthesis